jgi:hypothetical protein
MAFVFEKFAEMLSAISVPSAFHMPIALVIFLIVFVLTLHWSIATMTHFVDRFLQSDTASAMKSTLTSALTAISAAIAEQRTNPHVTISNISFLASIFLIAVSAIILVKGFWSYVFYSAITFEFLAAVIVAVTWLLFTIRSLAIERRRARAADVLSILHSTVKPTVADVAFDMLQTSERFRRKSYVVLTLSIILFILGAIFASVSGYLVDFDSRLFSSHADISKELGSIDDKLRTKECISALTVKPVDPPPESPTKAGSDTSSDTLGAFLCRSLVDQSIVLRKQLGEALQLKALTDEKVIDIDRRNSRALFLRITVLLVTGALFGVLLAVYKHAFYMAQFYRLAYASLIIEPMNEELRARIAEAERARLSFAKEIAMPLARFWRIGDSRKTRGDNPLSEASVTPARTVPPPQVVPSTEALRNEPPPKVG